jgi:hypothetical protein
MSMRNLTAVISAVLIGCSGGDGETAAAEDAATDTLESDTSLPDVPELDTMMVDAPVAEAEVGPVFQPFDINHVLGTGQSLSVGAVGSPALSTMQPFANLMFSKGVIPGGTGLTAFAPLVEAGTETHSSGFANNACKGKDHAILISAHGIGGTAYAGLKKGTTAFANGIAQVKAAKALADMMKRTYVVRGVTNVHGESDHVSGNKMYAENLAEWQADYATDVTAITGQTLPIPMFHTQMSSWTKYGQATSVIPQAQLDASRKSAGKLVLVGPKYTALYVSDGVHLSNLGYRLMGEYYAKAYRRVVLDGGTWTPLQPKSIARAGVTITLDLDVPVPPLVLDTTLVTDPGSYGFEVVDDGKPAKIMSVALAGPTSVKITLAAMPTGKSMRLRYAYTGIAGASGGAKTGPRGNLRDSDETTYASMTKLYNWCVHFDEAIP